MYLRKVTYQLGLRVKSLTSIVQGLRYGPFDHAQSLSAFPSAGCDSFLLYLIESKVSHSSLAFSRSLALK